MCSSDLLEGSSNNLAIPEMGAYAESPTSAKIIFKATNYQSYEVQILNAQKDLIIWSSGITNSELSEVTVLVSNLKCNTPYPVMVKVWSEKNGQGNLAIAPNDNQLRTKECGS